VSLALALSLSLTQKGWALLYETNSAEETVTIRFSVSLAANNDVNNRGRMSSVSHTLAAAHVQDAWTHLVAVCIYIYIYIYFHAHTPTHTHLTELLACSTHVDICLVMPILQHTSADVSIRQHTAAYGSIYAS
jgi:hypothetical protein